MTKTKHCIRNLAEKSYIIEGNFLNSADIQKKFIKKYNIKKGENIITWYNWSYIKEKYLNCVLKKL